MTSCLWFFGTVVARRALLFRAPLKIFLKCYSELNELIEKLDSFAGEAAKTQKNFIPERKARLLSDMESCLHHPN